MAGEKRTKVRTSIRDGILPLTDGARQLETNIRAEGLGIRSMFRISIAVIAVLAFIAIIAVSFKRVTDEEIVRANTSMQTEVNYICLQLDSYGKHRDAANRILGAVGATPEEAVAADAQDYALLTDPISEVLKGYTLGETGTVVIAKGDEVMASDNEQVPVGGSLQALLGSQACEAIESSIVDKEMKAIPLEGALASSEDEEGYLLAGKYDDFTVVIVEPSSLVLRDRGSTLGRESVATLVILVVVIIVVDRLLVLGVANRIDATNDKLEQIVAGDLDARVDSDGSREFRSLAKGINVTVDALKDWIGEAERRMEEDLATARKIQKGTLPTNFGSISNAHRAELFASMDPAREVGGDFYDFFEIDDHTTAFLIADVSGKGIPGALFMMSAKTEIENRLREGVSPAEAIAAANTYLCSNNEAGMFVTVWAATLDHRSGLLTYVNAGHNYQLLRHGVGGHWEWLRERCGLFLGVFETTKYRQVTLTMSPGDELLLYTDGVNEAFNVKGEEYGNDRLEKFLADHTNLAPEDIVRSLRSDVAAWAEGAEQSDDVTILALEVCE